MLFFSNNCIVFVSNGAYRAPIGAGVPRHKFLQQPKASAFTTNFCINIRLLTSSACDLQYMQREYMLSSQFYIRQFDFELFVGRIPFIRFQNVT